MEPKRIGVIAALQIEAENIFAAMEDVRREVIGGIAFTVGTLRFETEGVGAGAAEIVCAVCGAGKVNAALCCQTMLVRYAPDCVINTGVAGNLSRQLSIGDVALATSVVQHDLDTTAIGDPLGLIPGLGVVKIPADARVRGILHASAERLGVHCLDGVSATGDRFVADRETKDRLTAQFNAVACEMEGGAVGQVCALSGVPFAIVRAISDNADGGAPEDFPAFAKRSAEISAKIVVEGAKEI